MAFRRKMKRRTSKKIFRKTAGLTRKENFRAQPMRGGYRL